MENILKKIETLSIEELREVMKAVEQRYCTAFPDWEVVYVSVHKDPQLRQKDVQEIMAFLNNHPEIL